MGVCAIMSAWHTATRELSRLTTPMSHKIVGAPVSGATPLSQRIFDGPVSGASPFDTSLVEGSNSALLRSWAEGYWVQPENPGTPPRSHGTPPGGSPWESLWPAPLPVGL